MKRISLFIFFILAVLNIQAQSARALFDSIPESIVPLFTYVNRTDFADFLDSNMRAVIKNKLGNESEMTDLTEDYARIRMTSQSTWEMKLLPLNDSVKVICTVSTVCAPVCDSYVRFYTTDWEEISAVDFLTPPLMDDFFQVPDSINLDTYNGFRKKADMLLMRAELAKDSYELNFTFTTPEYAKGEEALDDWAPYLNNPLIYIWEYAPAKSEGRFHPVAQQ